MKTGKIFVKLNPLTFYFFFFFLLGLPGLSFAQLIGIYEFTGTTTQETQNNYSNATVQTAYATFSPVSRSGVQWWRGIDVYNNRYWAEGSEINLQNYIEFTIIAKPGFILQLDSISFKHSRSLEGPTQGRIAHNLNGDFTTNSYNFTPLVMPSGTLTKEKWLLNKITTTSGGQVTFRIYGWNRSDRLGTFRVDDLALYGSVVPVLRVNEFHYANTANTRTGFLEVALPKDYTQLNNITVSFYNGAGTVYGSYNLSLFKAINNGVFDEEKILYLDVPIGLAEGQGGISISSGPYLIQFVSYGGAFTAVSGPANGVKSQDILVTETAEDGAANSVFLTVANDTRFPAGIWTKGPSNSKGYPNTEFYTVLPVELLFFRPQSNSKEVSLVWATATEKDNDKFVVERSRQEVFNFEPIGTVKGSGTTQTQKQYRFTDHRPVPGTSYYRLKQIDIDGKVNYSPIVAVNRALEEQVVQVYPNPVSSLLNIDLGETTQVKQIKIQIVNATGRVIYQKNISPTTVEKYDTIPVADLPTGTYYLVLLKDGKPESKTFIKL